MRAFAFVAALAAPVALAQSAGGDDQDYGAIISSVVSQERSAASVLATASDTASAQSSILNDITKTFNPQQQSLFSSLTSQIGTDGNGLSQLATATGSAATSAIASISSQATSAAGSAASTGSRGASSAASTGSSAASAAAAPTNVAAAGLLGVAGVFGAAALVL